MKNYLLSLFLIVGFTSFTAFGQSDAEAIAKEEKTVKIVEASCGTCNFGLEGSGCSLAVKVDGETYPVQGVNFHSLGNAHGKDGMCNAVRVAEISGEIEEDIFVASSFKLLPMGTKLPSKKLKKRCSPECKKACCDGKSKSEKTGCAPGCEKACCS